MRPSALARSLMRSFSAKKIAKIFDGEPLMLRLPRAWENHRPGLWRLYIGTKPLRFRARVARGVRTWVWTIDRIGQHGHLIQVSHGFSRTLRRSKAAAEMLAAMYSRGEA